MSLGWHSGSGLGSNESSSSGTDPALLAVLQTIAAELSALTTAVNGVAAAVEAGGTGGEVLPECSVLAESGAYLVDESGAYILHECLGATGPVVVDEAGSWLVAEDESVVIYEAPHSIASDSGALLINEAGLQLETEVPA